MMELADQVRQEVDALRPLAEGASVTGLRDGTWLEPVVEQALDGYRPTLDHLMAQHLDLEGDALADARIAVAQRRAMVAGGLSAAAYASVVLTGLATGVGTVLAIPAAVSAFAVDLFYVTRIQLRLGLELATVYGHPVELEDPDRLLDLVRTSFGVDTDRELHATAGAFAPGASRLGSRAVTTASRLVQQRLLAATGQQLVQRGVVKFAFPAIGVPLCAGVNHVTTGTVGRSARNILRGRARALEVAGELRERTDLVAQVLLLVARADGRLRSAELTLLEALGGVPPTAATEPELFARLSRATEETRRAVYQAAVEAVALDGKLHLAERDLLVRLAAACGVPFDPREVTAAVWAVGRPD